MASLNFNQRYCIVGTGLTGLAAVRFLLAKGCHVELLDTRVKPVNRKTVEDEFDSIALTFGELDVFDFLATDIIVVSPGIATTESFIQNAKTTGAAITSDVEIFFTECEKPVVAITGSNGKSTVVTLLTHILQKLNIQALAAGNIGLPVLEAIKRDADIYILELSSFQLERLPDCPSNVACVLNLSEDHMDRYDSISAYNQAKSIIYKRAKASVVNAGDKLTWLGASKPLLSFGASEDDADFNYRYIDEDIYICKHNDALFNIKDMQLKGFHNIENVLACLAILDSLNHQSVINIALKDCIPAVCTFSGLDHRCQFVASISEVDFINDSKATNVGACLAAIKGLRHSYKNIIVLLGGVDKGADFSELSYYIKNNNVRAVIYGQDSKTIAGAFQEKNVAYQLAESMQQATLLAVQVAEQGSVILLSPACASFDAFENFNARGKAFLEQVNSMLERSEAIDD